MSDPANQSTVVPPADTTVPPACLSAASKPMARCSPVPESPICAPVTKGGPSGTPVVLIAPPIA